MRFFGRLLWIIITVTLVLVAASFAISNDAIINLKLWPLHQNIEIPTWLFGISAFVIGGILGAFLMWGQILVIRTKLWRAQSQIRKYEKQATHALEKGTSKALPSMPDN